MQIAINCRSILKQNSTGIGRYTYNLINSIAPLDQDNDYYLYAPRRLFDFKRRLANFPYKNFHRCYDFFNQGIPKTDLYHLPCPDYLGPKKSKLIVTIHDLIYKTYPQSHTAETILATDTQMKAIVQQADHIICISKNTRTDLHRYFNFDESRSMVVYNGINHHVFYPLNQIQRAQAFTNLHTKGIDQNYILFVGTLEPRKNLDGVLRAFALLKEQTKYQGQLVVVGMKGWMTDNIADLIKELKLEGSVKFLGFISDDDLRNLYNCADLFVFPSFYEGFGFPILEAFACGVPVITSNTSSCAELAEGKALTIDPNRVQDITDAMRKVIEDKTLSTKLIAQGLAYAKQFSFERTAQETLAVYKKIL